MDLAYAESEQIRRIANFLKNPKNHAANPCSRIFSRIPNFLSDVITTFLCILAAVARRGSSLFEWLVPFEWRLASLGLPNLTFDLWPWPWGWNPPLPTTEQHCRKSLQGYGRLRYAHVRGSLVVPISRDSRHLLYLRSTRRYCIRIHHL